jgi:hypothetical protein
VLLLGDFKTAQPRRVASHPAYPARFKSGKLPAGGLLPPSFGRGSRYHPSSRLPENAPARPGSKKHPVFAL